MNPVATIRRHGIWGTGKLYSDELKYRLACFRTRSVESYRNPTFEELLYIESQFAEMGIAALPVNVDSTKFRAFVSRYPFPNDYHGGLSTGFWDEKILEHYISYELLGIHSFSQNDIYLDVAAGGSPWVRILREKMGINSFSLDLSIHYCFRELSYYFQEDATKTSFASESVRGISLHCAYEMFAGDSDMRAISEFARILVPGSSVIIVPLYLHTHYCCYSSPECWGRGIAERDIKEYVRPQTRAIPFSRKYSPQKLRERVLEQARTSGLVSEVYYLQNKQDISPEIYCHFILKLTKP